MLLMLDVDFQTLSLWSTLLLVLVLVLDYEECRTQMKICRKSEDFWFMSNSVHMRQVKINLGKGPLSGETERKDDLLTIIVTCYEMWIRAFYEIQLIFALQEIMTNPSVLFNLPELLNIIGDADNEIFEDNLLLINDAYQVWIIMMMTRACSNQSLMNE